MTKSNIRCPLCNELMEIIPQMSDKWNKIYCPRQTCGLRCFVKDISKLITKKDRFASTDEALLLRRLEIKKLREHKKQLIDALECLLIVINNETMKDTVQYANKVLKETK